MNMDLDFITELEELTKDDQDLLETIKQIKKDPPCSMPWKHILANHDGTTTVCCLSNFHIGNLNDNTIEEIWNGQKIKKLRELFLNHNYKSCSIRCPFILDRVKNGKKCLTKNS